MLPCAVSTRMIPVESWTNLRFDRGGRQESFRGQDWQSLTLAAYPCAPTGYRFELIEGNPLIPQDTMVSCPGRVRPKVDPIESWEKRLRAAIDQVISGWNWSRVRSTWEQRILDFGISINPLFHEVVVNDPENPVRPTVATWWPADSIRNRQIDLQRHLSEYPGTRGPFQDDTLDGKRLTAELLWDHKEALEETAAIFISASLFPRLHSSRRDYPSEHWPPYYCVEVVDNWARNQWLRKGESLPWGHYHTEVLPERLWDGDYRITDMHSLVRYIGEETSTVLSKYKLVAIKFGPNPDPIVSRVLEGERERERRREAEWQEQQRKDAQRRAIRKKEHPRADEWHLISRAELLELVWGKPATKLAREFGVSDVAIAKRCKVLGVDKPPPGFWAQVAAEIVPHPNGRPPRKKR